MPVTNVRSDRTSFIALQVAVLILTTVPAHAATAAADRGAVTVDAFMAGATLSPAEVAVVVAE